MSAVRAEAELLQAAGPEADVVAREPAAEAADRGRPAERERKPRDQPWWRRPFLSLRPVPAAFAAAGILALGIAVGALVSSGGPSEHTVQAQVVAPAAPGARAALSSSRATARRSTSATSRRRRAGASTRCGSSARPQPRRSRRTRCSTCATAPRRSRSRRGVEGRRPGARHRGAERRQRGPDAPAGRHRPGCVTGGPRAVPAGRGKAASGGPQRCTVSREMDASAAGIATRPATAIPTARRASRARRAGGRSAPTA